ncbi:signal peptidase II, partial [Staphylococcus aureus]|uniref:signal peptidase II n=1 Tax=Staphylococcus aureus TaxID=1280 RepID=UPI0015D66844
MHKKYFIGTSILIAVFVVIFDQVTKYIIATTMKIGDSFEVIPHFLNITSHRNNGAAWGILSLSLIP